MNPSEAQLQEELAVCRARICALQTPGADPVLSDLAGRDRILSAVGNAAQRFMLGDNLATEINDLLRVLGQVTDVCRVYVFEHHRGSAGTPVVSQRYEWTREGIPSEIHNQELQELPCDDPSFVRINARLQSGEVVEGDLDAFDAAERALLEPQGILSLLLVPILIQSDWWGFIGLDSCRVHRRWATAEVDALIAMVR